MKVKDLNTKQIFEYLDINENENYMYKYKQLYDFRLLEQLTRNFKNREICLVETFNNVIGTDNTKIIYQYNDLIAFENKGG